MHKINDLLISSPTLFIFYYLLTFFNAHPTVYSAERQGMTVMLQMLHHGHSLLKEFSKVKF
jgi:hypothetical protein